MGDADDKPFACNEPDCTMKFANEDHLMVHLKRHQMQLTLDPNGSGSKFFFQDQTPTPTKFLENCEKIGLFSEIKEINKNPFDDAFSKAVTGRDSKLASTPSNESPNLLSVHTEITDTLNTPTPQLQTDTPLKKRYLRYQSLENAPEFSLSLPSQSDDSPTIKSSTIKASDPVSKHKDAAKPAVNSLPSNFVIDTPKVHSALKRQSPVSETDLIDLPHRVAIGADATDLSTSEPITKRFRNEATPIVSPMSTGEVQSSQDYGGDDSRLSAYEQETSQGYGFYTQQQQQQQQQQGIMPPAASNAHALLSSPRMASSLFSRDGVVGGGTDILSPQGGGSASNSVAGTPMSGVHSVAGTPMSGGNNSAAATPMDILNNTHSPRNNYRADNFSPASGRQPDMHSKADYLRVIQGQPGQGHALQGQTLTQLQTQAQQQESLQHTLQQMLTKGDSTLLNHTSAIATSTPVKQEPIPTQPTLVQGATAVQMGPNSGLAVQLMVRMPGGELMPVHLPATMATNPGAAVQGLGVAGNVPTAIVNENSNDVTLPSVIKDEGMKPEFTPMASPSSIGVTSTSTAASTINASSLTKQKLKAQLLQNNSDAGEKAKPNGAGSEALNHSQRYSFSSLSRDSSQDSSFDIEYQDADSTNRFNHTGGDGSIKHEDETEVKRQRFLERNRAAATRCRNKKKQWVHGLEKKAEALQSDNSRLQNEVSQLRAEVVQLKSLLLAHKDCPVTNMQREKGMLHPLTDTAAAATQHKAPTTSSAPSTNVKIVQLITASNAQSAAQVVPIATHSNEGSSSGGGEQWVIGESTTAAGDMAPPPSSHIKLLDGLGQLYTSNGQIFMMAPALDNTAGNPSVAIDLTSESHS